MRVVSRITKLVTSHSKYSGSLEELAQHLGLSVGTVSRAMNNHPKVSQRTKERIQRVAKETGYVPNPLARGLSGGRSSLIGVLFSHFVNTVSGHFLIRLIKQLEALELRPLIKIGNPLMESNADIIKDFAMMKVEGVIIVGATLEPDSPVLAPLIRGGIPYSALNIGGGASVVHTVQYERRRVEREMIAHLLDDGHKYLALLGFKMTSSTFVTRSAILKEMYEERGLDFMEFVQNFDPPRLPSESTFAFGYRLAREVHKSGFPATAYLGSNDEVAIGAIRSLIDLDINVPKDISVVGYDNLGFSGYTSPTLTTIDLEADKTVAMLLNVLTHQMNKSSENEDLAPHFIEPTLLIRQSTGPAASMKGKPKASKSRKL